MRFIKSIYQHFNYHTDESDRAIIYLTILILFLSTIFITLNLTIFHYQQSDLFSGLLSDWLLPWKLFFWETMTPSLLFFIYGIYIRRESPKSSTLLWGIGFLPICIFLNTLLASAVESTPFAPIDLLLVKLDQLMHIDTTMIMEWTHDHPRIHQLLSNAYFSLPIELIAIPMMLTLFCARKPLVTFYLAQLSTILIGVLIYYFFPTMAPSGVLHSPYFSVMQKNTSLRFNQMHHYLNITVHGDCGLIAFPSFHVIWAILLTNALRDFKVLFYPAAIWNTIIVISTVFLGWHYFIDVIGGTVLAIGGIVFGNWVFEKNTSQIANESPTKTNNEGAFA